MPNENQNEPGTQTKARDERITRLSAQPMRAKTYSRGYSRFIRTMKMALPLVAVAMTVAVFVWSSAEEDLIPAPADPAETHTIGKNELLNPLFESTDDKKQPYTIKAKRAVQGQDNENLIILEEPLGDILLENNTWLAIGSDQGAYRQDNQRLLLKGNVKIYHDQGYQLTTEQLDIDIKNSSLWTSNPVSGHGPAGTITASGMRGDMNTGILNFEGHAKLVLHNTGTRSSLLSGGQTQ